MTGEGAAGNGHHALISQYGIERLAELVRSMVSAERYAHSVRVAELTAEIAEANQFTATERRQAVTAALLHDAARDLSPARLAELAPPRIELEVKHPLALHGRAARALASAWGVTDERVLAAAEGHVFGVPPTDRVGAALYVADVSEPGRGVNADLRALALSDLKTAYRQAVATKIAYLKRLGKAIHPATLATYQAVMAVSEGAEYGGLTPPARGAHR